MFELKWSENEMNKFSSVSYQTLFSQTTSNPSTRGSIFLYFARWNYLQPRMKNTFFHGHKSLRLHHWDVVHQTCQSPKWIVLSLSLNFTWIPQTNQISLQLNGAADFMHATHGQFAHLPPGFCSFFPKCFLGAFPHMETLERPKIHVSSHVPRQITRLIDASCKIWIWKSRAKLSKSTRFPWSIN